MTTATTDPIPLDVGALVKAPKHPEWGTGRVIRFTEAKGAWPGTVTAWFGDDRLRTVAPADVAVVEAAFHRG